jgi:hypothetical protein
MGVHVDAWHGWATVAGPGSSHSNFALRTVLTSVPSPLTVVFSTSPS